jgi:hypothetical protein
MLDECVEDGGCRRHGCLRAQHENLRTVSAPDDLGRGGRLFQADPLVGPDGRQLPLDAGGHGKGIEVSVRLAVPRAAQALVPESPGRGGTRGRRRAPHRLVFRVLDGYVPRLGCHAAEAAIHAAVQDQRTADALPEHRDQCDIQPFEAAFVEAVDGQRVHVILDDSGNSA